MRVTARVRGAACRALLAGALGVMLLGGGASHAQPRERLALVLSGGGAAGAAHVGVIRALEEVGIRPDCIAGTSMGAVVGGLYASGLTAMELAEAVETTDWLTILDDNADRVQRHPMRRSPRSDPRSLFSILPLGADETGVRADAGLIDGNSLELRLRELAAKATNIDDFDALPIPFRAVAADLATGQPVVLRDGDLALAMRTSMSIPALFPPVKRDGRVLVDGGVASNLPIGIGKALCGDRIIAVNIPPSNPDPASLTSLTGAVGQTLSLFIHRSSREEMQRYQGQFDLITPPVQEIGMLDFPLARQAMDLGYEAAKPVAAKLAARYPSDRIAAALISRPGEPERIRVERLEIDNDTNYADQVIEEYLGIEPPVEITLEELKERLARLYGLGVFDRVTYRISRANTLRIIARKREAGPTEFRLGLAFEDSFDGRARYVLGGGVGFTELDALGRRVDIDAFIGSDQFASVAFEQPLDYGQRWFFTADATYLALRAPVSVDPRTGETGPGGRIADYWLRTVDIGADIHYAPTDTLRFSFGPAYRYRIAELSTGAATLPDDVDGDGYGGRFRLRLDTLDNSDLPMSGVSLDTEVFLDASSGGVGDPAGSFIIDALGAYPVTFGSLQAYVRGGSDIGDDENTVAFNPIGGFQRLSGFERNALIGDVAGVVGTRAIARSALIEGTFGVAGFVGAGVEYGGIFESWDDVNTTDGYMAASVFAGLQSRFGPLYIGYGFAEGGNQAIYFGFGERF